MSRNEPKQPQPQQPPKAPPNRLIKEGVHPKPSPKAQPLRGTNYYG